MLRILLVMLIILSLMLIRLLLMAMLDANYFVAGAVHDSAVVYSVGDSNLAVHNDSDIASPFSLVLCLNLGCIFDYQL